MEPMGLGYHPLQLAQEEEGSLQPSTRPSEEEVPELDPIALIPSLLDPQESHLPSAHHLSLLPLDRNENTLSLRTPFLLPHLQQSSFNPPQPPTLNLHLHHPNEETPSTPTLPNLHHHPPPPPLLPLPVSSIDTPPSTRLAQPLATRRRRPALAPTRPRTR